MGRQRQEHCVPSGSCVQGEMWKVGGMLRRGGEVQDVTDGWRGRGERRGWIIHVGNQRGGALTEEFRYVQRSGTIEKENRSTRPLTVCGRVPQCVHQTYNGLIG